MKKHSKIPNVNPRKKNEVKSYWRKVHTRQINFLINFVPGLEYEQTDSIMTEAYKNPSPGKFKSKVPGFILGGSRIRGDARLKEDVDEIEEILRSDPDLDIEPDLREVSDIDIGYPHFNTTK